VVFDEHRLMKVVGTFIISAFVFNLLIYYEAHLWHSLLLRLSLLLVALVFVFGPLWKSVYRAYRLR
jgi:hypothetical protein